MPLTGTQYRIAAGDYAAIVTELGAGLRELTHQGQAVIAGYEPDELPPGAEGQLLIPWPNRIEGGRYAVNGTTHQLDLSEPANGNAIHGLTRWMPWTAVERTADAVVLHTLLPGRAGYPFCLDVEAHYRLSATSGLQVSIIARNVGARAAPYGTGGHPYLVAGAPAVDDCELTLPCSHWLPVDSRGIPSGSPRDVTGTDVDFRTGHPIGTTRLDHALTGLARDGQGRAWARLTGADRSVALWAGPGYRWLQVFTGDTLDPAHRRRAIAVEPMTCPPNAFASGTDLLMLDPGRTVTHTWGIEASEPPRRPGVSPTPGAPR